MGGSRRASDTRSSPPLPEPSSALPRRTNDSSRAITASVASAGHNTDIRTSSQRCLPRGGGRGAWLQNAARASQRVSRLTSSLRNPNGRCYRAKRLSFRWGSHLSARSQELRAPAQRCGGSASCCSGLLLRAWGATPSKASQQGDANPPRSPSLRRLPRAPQRWRDWGWAQQPRPPRSALAASHPPERQLPPTCQANKSPAANPAASEGGPGFPVWAWLAASARRPAVGLGGRLCSPSGSRRQRLHSSRGPRGGVPAGRCGVGI